MADPDTVRQIADGAQHAVDQGGEVVKNWAGIGAAVGGAFLFVSRRLGSGRVVAAIREEMGATRNTMRTEGLETRKELGDLRTAVAHLAGRVEGIR
jgi:hypothetical protein